MTTALVLKVVLPLLLLALFAVLCENHRRQSQPPHFNARQQQMIDSLKTANTAEKDLE